MAIEIPAAPAWVRSHAILMVVSWGLLLPVGVVMSMCMRVVLPAPKWFSAHKYLQMSGLLLGTVGVVVAMAELPVHFQSVHTQMGIAIMILAWTQPLNALLRPHAPKDTSETPCGRRVWELVHKNLGRLLCILALANIALGEKLRASLYGGGAALSYGMLGACLVVCVAVAAFGMFRGKQADKGGPNDIQLA